MANSNNSVITGKFRGTIGKELVFREWDGKIVVAKPLKQELVRLLLGNNSDGYCKVFGVVKLFPISFVPKFY